MADRRKGKHQPGSDVAVWVVIGTVTVATCVLMVAVVIPALTSSDEEPDAPVDAEQAAFLYERNCGTCHGLEGQGNIGPALGDGAVAATYPDIEDEIAVIADGRNAMPPFADSLTETEIRAIAEYTRTDLGTDQSPSSTIP